MEVAYKVLGLLLIATAFQCDSQPCYDHQIDDYVAKFEVAQCNEQCTVTPFFSPDHSIDTYVDLIQSAKESIDLYTPGKKSCTICEPSLFSSLSCFFSFLPLAATGFNSWSNCTNFSNTCNKCMGCTIEEQKEEDFPVFAALLNAVHRGVKIRMVTNNFTQTSCEGKISPLDWLHLNGVGIRWYVSTTFMHSKVVIVDGGKRTSVSSVNFSFTSFMMNREAGVVVEDCTCPLTGLYQKVFQQDWDSGNEFKEYATYSSDDMAVITSSSPMKVKMPSPRHIYGAYVTQKVTYSNVTVVKGYTSPDGARDQFFSDLSNIKSSLQASYNDPKNK